MVGHAYQKAYGGQKSVRYIWWGSMLLFRSDEFCIDSQQTDTNLYSFPDSLKPQFFPTQIGPHAVNLAGGQAASMRIAKDIIWYQPQDVLKVSELSGQKSKTEEYIQQMKGLLWL